MQTRTLGNTGVEVSALCLGAMYFGSRNDKNTSFQMLDTYFAAGGSFIDTANIYAHWVPGGQGGESESLLGEWMRKRDNRHQLFIATKVGFEYADVERGLTAKQIEAEAEKSLKRLGVDTIDLYYAHADDYHTPLEETLEAFTRLARAGKVRFIGASNYRAWRLEEARAISEANGWPRYCCVQQRYTYIRKRPGTTFDPQLAVNEDLLDYARHRQFPIIAYSVLLSGAFTRGDRPFPNQYLGPDTDARLKMVHTIAKETGASVNQVILAWMLHHEAPTIPLIAASNLDQMQDNLDALDVRLSKDQMRRLNMAAG